MQWFRFLHKDHRASHCTKTITNTNSDKQTDDDKYKSIKLSKSTNTDKAASITKPCNYKIKVKKEFMTLNNRIEQMENEDSDLNNSDGGDKEKSHFQFE